MRAEDLVSRSAAHGVDLVQAAAIAARKRAPAGVIRKNRATILIPPPQSRARGSETRTFERPAWSIAELGQAAQGVPAREFMAACYAFAGDRTYYWRLHAELTMAAQEVAADRRWPPTVHDVHKLQRPYLAMLAKLVLDEDAMPEQFRAVPERYPVYMFTTAEIWERDLAERFQDLKAIWGAWLQDAARIIQRHLADGEMDD